MCSSSNGLIELPIHCVAVRDESSSTIGVRDTESNAHIKENED